MRRLLFRHKYTWVCMVLLAGLAFVMFAEFALSKDEPELSRGIDLLDQGRRSLDLRALDEAKAIFTNRIKNNPQDWQNYYYRARVNLYLYSYYSEVKLDPVKATTALTSALSDAIRAEKLNPKSAAVHALLGRIYQVQMGLNPVGTVISAAVSEVPALEEYKKALELDPKNAEAEMGLGTYYLFAPRFLGGNRDRAIKHFKLAVKRDPLKSEAWVWLSVAHREDGRLDRARESLNTALSLDADSRFAKAENKRLKQAEKRGR